jgi:hypothetical protein
MTDSSGNRRDFLRNLFSRAAREAASKVPDSLAETARLVQHAASGDAALTAEELAHAFCVPSDQVDIAGALVTQGTLVEVGQGLFAERHGLSHGAVSLGTATRSWIDRLQAGDGPVPTRARDAVLLETVRSELHRDR